MRDFVESGEAGKSRRAVAVALKMDESTLRSWENPEGPSPRLEMVYKFCDKFSVPLWEFLGEKDRLVAEIQELSQKVGDLEARLAGVRDMLADPAQGRSQKRK